ncbi:MAG: sigma-70 family RNA polymerase sigma factor [Candidatus Rokubacteria bacterium]|nr:sigma-70 family RNA polymerase sigma factor [Candidatus Rokubacteria bacterium]
MDQLEFQDLVRTNLDSLYNYAQVLARFQSDAEDLLQETLLRAFRAFSSFKRELSFKVWLFKIMKNARIDRDRRVRVRPVEEEWKAEDDLARDVLVYPVPLNPEEILLRRLTLEEVREAIRRLPIILREVVELREIEGLSYQQIAEVIDRPIGTVMSRLYRGRHLLRSSLQEPPTGWVKSRSAHGL